MKKQVNKTILLGAASFIALFGVIVICSFFPFMIEPERWMTIDFWSEEMITVSIAVLSMILMMGMSIKANAANPQSELALAKVEYSKTIALIGDDVAFGKWVKDVFQPEDLRVMRVNHIKGAGVMDEGILGLSESDLRGLLDAEMRIGGKEWPHLTKKQYKAVMDVKRGRITTRLVPPDYYLTCRSYQFEKTLTEKSGNESKAKSALVGVDIASKMAMVVIPAMILTSLVYDATAGQMSTADVWLNFFSRVFTMFGGMFNGWITGVKYNNIDASYISIRSGVHRKYGQWKEAHNGDVIDAK